MLNLNRKPDDEKLLQAFDQAHQRTSECYDTGRFGRTGFVVKHFAGDVSYAIDGFLSKNNDSIQDDLVSKLFGLKFSPLEFWMIDTKLRSI